MKRASIFALLAVICAAMFASAQQPPAPPKPAPELAKLNYFLGDWKVEGDAKPSPMGPGGKFTGTSRNEWMPGKFFIVLHTTGDMAAMGKVIGHAYLGYDPEEKTYTYHEFNSVGEAVSAKGNVQGDTWTWTNEEKMQGKVMKGRFTEKVTSPTSYDFKFEASMDGGPFQTLMEGKATRTSAAASSAKSDKAEKKPEPK
ncbi:MAG TPA: DUF1579 family protein [Candidatus Angelobacter sp.]|jgi:hypothetical protein